MAPSAATRSIYLVPRVNIVASIAQEYVEVVVYMRRLPEIALLSQLPNLMTEVLPVSGFT